MLSKDEKIENIIALFLNSLNKLVPNGKDASVTTSYDKLVLITIEKGPEIFSYHIYDVPFLPTIPFAVYCPFNKNLTSHYNF